MEIKCPYCGYDGSDLKIGRTMPYITIGGAEMRCSNCRRTWKIKQQIR